jgi:hypothetical protein
MRLIDMQRAPRGPCTYRRLGWDQISPVSGSPAGPASWSPMEGCKAREARRFYSARSLALAMATPSGTRPVLTLRQREMASLRANAISMMRRIRLDWPAVLWMYQIESGWLVDISARAMRLRSECAEPNCCRPWIFPGTASSIRCHKRAA